ncbi:ABC transporter substrate-binding protein [Anaerobacillus arseniciselenatis]|uniref:ABC transporter substrate-binding protein n=1 Tax=Anaerobacillus arseniciselenatis TaxID=85682 RepID=A0A1S2LNC9_9BACI|nr:extracellular solute-binding protein [Anaerobacillus arseniciselenatis]OIJ13856.1 ABC transporter substrate-binding protein [Anaerobacillus arseniciselenatis]
MIKKLFSLILVLTLVGLGGCGPADDPDATDPTPGTDGEVVDESTISFTHLWPAGSSAQHNRIVESIISEYEEANPGVTIDVDVLSNDQYKETMTILASSRQLPDVGLTWAAGYMTPFVNGNMFASLDDVIEDGLGEEFIPGTVEAFSVNETAYGLPLELNIAPIYYNKNIFAEYDLEVPETYDEFLNVVQTLEENGVTPITVGNREPWTGSMWYMYLADRIGGPELLTNAIERTDTFEDEALVQAAEEIQNLVDMNAFVRGFNGLGNEEAKGPFMNEQAAMYMMGTWELPNYTTNEDVPQEFRDSIGFFKFPMVEGGAGDIDSFVGGPGVGLFVSEDSPVQEQAKDFVQFFVERWGETSVTDAGVIPATVVNTDEVDLPDMYIDILDELAGASNITLYADVQMTASVAQTHLDLIQSLFGKHITPEEFAKRHEEALAAEE